MKKYLLSIVVITILFACKKEAVLNNGVNATLNFSTDTITFDTVFTSIGSITKTLTVYNRNNYNVKSNIAIEGYSSAHFRMNIDGNAGNEQNNIEIPAKDSIFIFLEVTIDPSSNSTPYILADSIVFTTGTIKQDVDLVAWGQDAYFHTVDTFGIFFNQNGDSIPFYYHILENSTTWTNEKPHVIYGYIFINPGQTLTINPGCNIYLHKNSGIIVGNPFSQYLGGTIKINGELGNEVTIQGDRLDSWYKDIPGQWDRILISPGSVDNEINYAIIRNGNIGIQADSLAAVEINNTVIENMAGIGILGQEATITANNTVISKCGLYSVACNIGGTYNFTHCTFANYWDYSKRNTPSILLKNWYEGADGYIYSRDLNEANFTNCIIDGSLSTEVSFQENEKKAFNYLFNHCLIKLDPDEDTENPYYVNSIINQAVNFEDAYEDDFHLTEESPAIDAGNNYTLGSSDIEGNTRNYDNPDIGAYEFE